LLWRWLKEVLTAVQDTDQARPTIFVEGSASLLVMHGGSDETVRIVNARMPAARVRKGAQRGSIQRICAAQPHRLIPSVKAPFPGCDPVYADMLAFMDRLSAPAEAS
jgi:hypothetical protein